MPRFSTALSTALLSLLLATGCQLGGGEALDTPNGDAAAWPGGRHVVHFENALGEQITGILVLPPGEARVPGVTVFHGSGGLFRPPEDRAEFDPATGTFERQFREWEALLSAEGYAVFFPASFYSRGYFDWNDEAPEALTNADRLWFRAHDAVAATHWLCQHPRVDCERTGTVGFSNGGSTVLMSEYLGLPALEAFEEIVVPLQSPTRLAVTFYPGCALEGFVPLEGGDYRPRVPVLMLHGNRDRLYDNCTRRVEQTRALGGDVDLRVFEAGHSFDASPDSAAERRARDQARAMTLERFAEAFDAP